LEAGFDECSPDGDGEKGEDGSAEDKRDDEEWDKPENGDEESFSEFFEMVAQRHGCFFEEAELVEWAWDGMVLGAWIAVWGQPAQPLVGTRGYARILTGPTGGRIWLDGDLGGGQWVGRARPSTPGRGR